MRSFVALPLPDEAAQAIERLQSALPVGRIVPPENLHLTLAFLDEQPPDLVEAAHEALEGLRLARFEVALRGLDLFDRARPDVLFLGVAANPALEAAQRSVMAALRGAGLDLPRRRFRPHVTLARFAGRLTEADEARLAAFLTRHAATSLWPFTADAIVLYRSTLSKSGAIHEELARYPLG